MPRVAVAIAALVVALGTRQVEAEEAAGPPSPVESPAVAPADPAPLSPPPPNQWVLVVPHGSQVVVPGCGCGCAGRRPSSRDLTRVRRAMELEGPDFSQEAFDRYRSQKGGGITLTVLGGVSLYASFFLTLLDESPWGIAGLVVGVTGLGVGIPMMVRGIRGKGRQALLKRKDEILGGASSALRISAAPLPGGMALGATIAF
jgi:hypothetical protein